MLNENLGAAERIIQTLLQYTDHLYHGRPGAVVADNRSPIGTQWFPVICKTENNQRIVYKLTKVGKRSQKTKIGILQPDNSILDGTRKVAEYREPGLYKEAAVWMYRQVAEVYKLDNTFTAHWASFAFGQEHRDLKVVLAAFMLVQNRCGEPIKENGKVVFFDDDLRDIGEAMVLIRRKDSKDLNPRMLLRVHNLLQLPEVAQINRELGFGKSARKPFVGRWTKAVQKWLNHREENPKMLEGLVKAGYKTTVMELARRTGYKPTDASFFETLRWKQSQAKDGRRQLAIGKARKTIESWDNLTEEQICERIVKERPGFKRLIGLLNKTTLTPAMISAAIESNCMSNKDLTIYTPTLEELGLLNDKTIRARWELAIKYNEDMRSAHIADRVKSRTLKEKLQEGADNALKKTIEEDMKNMRVYLMVDRSGSMQISIEEAKKLITKFVQGFPLDRLHVCVFNTIGTEINIRHASAAGVQNAFRGVAGSGGTDYGAAVRCLQKYTPKANEDVLFVFIGDEGAADFHVAVRNSGLNPTAFGFLKVTDPRYPDRRFAVQNTAKTLGIPCFMINQEVFEDPYAIQRTIRNLIAATPVNREVHQVENRVSLADQILKTELLKKPIWASV